jgi:hypothetical protein
LAAAVIGLSIGFALTLAVACGRSVTFSDHVDGHKSQGTMGHAPALHAVR